MVGFVYILECSNKRFYIGSTSDINRRLFEHQNGKSKATRNLLPVKLVFFQEYSNLQDARRIEFKLKKLKSRGIIEQIIFDSKIYIK